MHVVPQISHSSEQFEQLKSEYFKKSHQIAQVYLTLSSGIVFRSQVKLKITGTEK